ncbi:fumarylacetoacetate hydrolase [Candidatus Bathyarchaeota archaeon B24-2]|nr:MAG: fumarylacetoacetate hydrolase [Candidatus Bathyarchaeota archaeon B24-2]
MRIVRYRDERSTYLGMLKGEKVAIITMDDGTPFSCFIDLMKAAYDNDIELTEFVRNRIEERDFSYHDLYESKTNSLTLLSPIDPPEVWGCGITYKSSRSAREFETKTKGLYDLVYEAERPEIFFKATASRCVGPNQEICIRGDSKWTVPEAELAFILGPEEEVVGFTVGNDVSARDIEGENPLYLPQAKIYRGCCALGPTIVTVDEVGKEPDLEVECKIYREGELVFKGSTRTSKMKRRIEELRSYLCRFNPVPVGTVCLTGTGIVPPDDFALRDGDLVEITIEKIGTLRNPVKQL